MLPFLQTLLYVGSLLYHTGLLSALSQWSYTQKNDLMDEINAEEVFHIPTKYLNFSIRACLCLASINITYFQKYFWVGNLVKSKLQIDKWIVLKLICIYLQNDTCLIDGFGE